MSKLTVSLLTMGMALIMFSCQQQTIEPEVLPFQGELLMNVDIEQATETQQPVAWGSVISYNNGNQLNRHAHSNGNHSLATIVSEESKQSASWVQTADIPALANGTVLDFTADIMARDFTGSVTLTWEGSSNGAYAPATNDSDDNCSDGCGDGSSTTKQYDPSYTATKFKNSIILTEADLTSGAFQTIAMDQLIEMNERGARKIRVTLMVNEGSNGTVYFDNISIVATAERVAHSPTTSSR